MSLSYLYPEYEIDLTEETLNRCCDMGARLAAEVGLTVRHEKFLDAIRNKPGVRIAGDRVYFDPKLLRDNIEKHRAKLIKSLAKQSEKPKPMEWQMACGGFSMAVLDIETDEVRLATRQDLRELIKLVNSFGLGGQYPVMPQDLPPLMRALACFKICWESSDNIRPYDYLHRRQTPFLYEMHQVMGKPFSVTLCMVQPMMIDENDIDTFMDFYPKWKRNRDVGFSVLNYPMLGITKPVTLTGAITMYIAETFSAYTLFNTFDPELETPVNLGLGHLTDLRHACWAWGHPRQHMVKYLSSRIPLRFARVKRNWYADNYFQSLLETASPAIDEQAGIERMGVALLAALQGGRDFSGLGSLCVDDLFSGVQFVIDVEIISYIREMIEAFAPPTDIISMDDDMYDALKSVCLGKDSFISLPETAQKVRNIMPSSNRLVREKLRSWMEHRKTLKDRAREECVERIKNFKQEFHLSEDKQKALDAIYSRAEKALAG